MKRLALLAPALGLAALALTACGQSGPREPNWDVTCAAANDANGVAYGYAGSGSMSEIGCPAYPHLLNTSDLGDSQQRTNSPYQLVCTDSTASVALTEFSTFARRGDPAAIKAAQAECATTAGQHPYEPDFVRYAIGMAPAPTSH
jgi:hypothetical protein